MKYWLPDTVYNVAKWVGLILLPALAVLIHTVGPAWGMPYVEQIVLTINALGVFIGALIGASHVTAEKAE